MYVQLQSSLFSMVGFMCSVLFNIHVLSKQSASVCVLRSVQVAELHWRAPMKTLHTVCMYMFCLCVMTLAAKVSLNVL